MENLNKKLYEIYNQELSDLIIGYNFNPKRIEQMMDLIAQRQKALGSNLANVDTPGYIRQDLDFGQYLSTMNSPLETKLSEKLGPSAIGLERSEEPVNAGNEIMQMQENSILYSMATRRMTNIVTEMKTVINVNIKTIVNVI